MTHLNNAHAPSHEEILKTSKSLYEKHGEDEVMKYLAEVASNDFSCPDRCDEWACEFYNEYENEIEDK